MNDDDLGCMEDCYHDCDCSDEIEDGVEDFYQLPQGVQQLVKLDLYAAKVLLHRLISELSVEDIADVARWPLADRNKEIIIEAR